jgi:hypothetical protein
MARKSKNQNQDAVITDLGVDIGYGNVKVVGNGISLMFPSVAGNAIEERFGGDDNAEKYPNERIEHNGTSMWVGNLALGHLRAEQQRRLRGRSSSNDEAGMDFRLLMVKTALAKAFPDVHNGDVLHIRIVTGLPVNHMKQAAALKSALIGQHPVHTDRTNFVANICDVAVMPEPRGTMFAFTLKPDGDVNEYYDAETTVVFNGGAVTNDVQYDKNGEFVDVYSGSSRTGYHLAFEYLQNLIEERYGEFPSLEVVDSIIKKRAFKVHNDLVPMGEEVDEALKPVRAGALQLLADTINTGMTVDKLIVSGGFAMTSFDVVKRVYKQSERSQTPLMDTAQGYYNYSQMKWSNS